MTALEKITPHLWFDKEAKEAAGFYASVFPDSQVKSSTELDNTPSGKVELLTIELMEQEFALISAGPYFKFNPTVSFLVACRSQAEVEALWSRLSPGGTPLMGLGKYPFSERYGWIQDKYGLSWQLMSAADRALKQRITATLMFAGKLSGKAEEAMEFYTKVFPDSKIEGLLRYEPGEEPDSPGTLKHAEFTLAGQAFAAMDSAREHPFTFNEAISFIVHCDTQEEIDYYWNKLTADPAAEQCGWLKDKYGLSWQVVPRAMGAMLASNDPQKRGRVTEAFLKMKKFDIKALEKAYDG